MSKTIFENNARRSGGGCTLERGLSLRWLRPDCLSYKQLQYNRSFAPLDGTLTCHS